MNSLIQKVEEEYGWNILKFGIIKHVKDEVLVAKIKTVGQGTYIVKSVSYVDESKLDFVTKAEQLLKSNGLQILCPIPTKQGKLFFMHEGVPTVIYEWVDGIDHTLETASDFKNVIQTIAKLHEASHGLEMPAGTKIYSNVDWQEEYRKKLKTIANFRQLYCAPSDKRKKEFLKKYAFFYKMGKKALKLLQSSDYASLSKLPSSEQTLIHGDTHQGNILRLNNRTTMIDFTDMCYDLPSKDLVRIYSKFIKRKHFEPTSFEQMFHWYEAIHPLDENLKSVILIDFLFPHTYERLIRLKKFNTLKSSEIRRILTEERKKIKYIHKTYFK